jgi:hypothetical protein
MYLNLLAEHFHATIPTIEIHTDSESSLKRIAKSRNQQRLTFPTNETLSPSWDVHQAIQQELKKLPNVSLHHVQSHQDRATPLDQLSPIARLNIIADELASTLYDSSVFEELVPVAPSVGAHLDINGKTLVSSKYRSTSREIRRTQNIKAWIKEKTGMAEDAFNQVDWQSQHSMAVSRSQVPHPIIVKLLHQLLPVGTVIHRYDPVKYMSLCPTCKAQDEETYGHLLQCGHPTSHVVGWKSALRTDLLKYTIL